MTVCEQGRQSESLLDRIATRLRTCFQHTYIPCTVFWGSPHCPPTGKLCWPLRLEAITVLLYKVNLKRSPTASQAWLLQRHAWCRWCRGACGLAGASVHSAGMQAKPSMHTACQLDAFMTIMCATQRIQQDELHWQRCQADCACAGYSHIPRVRVVIVLWTGHCGIGKLMPVISHGSTAAALHRRLCACGRSTRATTHAEMMLDASCGMRACHAHYKHTSACMPCTHMCARVHARPHTCVR